MAGGIETNCAGCGYDLMGLADAGRCPECGSKYDKVSGRGVTRTSATGRADARGDRVVLLVKVGLFLLLALGCVAVGVWRSLDAIDWERALLAWGGVGAVFVFAAFVTWYTDGK
ncbi:MAG: hypothetical protein AAF800_12035 [Planctomycetota bacterium]